MYQPMSGQHPRRLITVRIFLSAMTRWSFCRESWAERYTLPGMTVCSLLPANTRPASRDSPTTAPAPASLNRVRREKRRGAGGGGGASMRREDATIGRPGEDGFQRRDE